MIRARYLADVRGVRVGVQADLDQIAQSGGDFHAEALGAELEEASAPRHVVAAHRAHARDRKTLVFVPTVALAHTIARAFRAAGTPAEALDGGTPSEMRRAILERLRRGETQLVANVGVLSEGFDEPSVDCVVMATPTRSQVKYAQCVGRALRPFPDKRDCLVIDVVGVSDRLDLQTLPRLFDLRGQPDPAITVTEALERQSTRERTPAGARRRARGLAEARSAVATCSCSGRDGAGGCTGCVTSATGCYQPRAAHCWRSCRPASAGR